MSRDSNGLDYLLVIFAFKLVKIRRIPHVKVSGIVM